VKPRISLITLGVADLEHSVAFYRYGLGLPQKESPPSVAFFDLTGTWLGLFNRESLAKDAGVSAQCGGFHGFTMSHNLASKAEVDLQMVTAMAASARLIKPAQKVVWGGYAGYFADPDDYLWEIAYNPLMWVGPTDAA
jgi:catechol 2,3-dioxygenase-like lactoylglutathione lyase family enzyme